MADWVCFIKEIAIINHMNQFSTDEEGLVCLITPARLTSHLRRI